PLPERIVDPGSEPLLLFLHAGFQPVLDQDDAGVHDISLYDWTERKKALVLFLGAEAHNVFDAGTVVPAAVEDHDFSGGRKMLHAALEKNLTLFPVGRRGEGHGSKHARAYLFSHGPDRTSFAGGVAALEQYDNP